MISRLLNPPTESQIIYERYGFFEGVDNHNTKGLATVDYEENEGELKIGNFEIAQDIFDLSLEMPSLIFSIADVVLLASISKSNVF